MGMERFVSNNTPFVFGLVRQQQLLVEFREQCRQCMETELQQRQSEQQQSRQRKPCASRGFYQAGRSRATSPPILYSLLNLTSRIMANFYLSFLDHYVKHDLGIEMYGRYVDDFFLIHRDKDFLKECLYSIGHFLHDELHLGLNPKKVCLQPVNHGVKFLGVVVEPGHTNVARRTVSNFKKTIDSTNSTVNDHRQSKSEVQKSIASINSYLGLLSHYNTFSVRSLWIDRFDSRFSMRVEKNSKVSRIRFIR